VLESGIPQSTGDEIPQPGNALERQIADRNYLRCERTEQNGVPGFKFWWIE